MRSTLHIVQNQLKTITVKEIGKREIQPLLTVKRQELLRSGMTLNYHTVREAFSKHKGCFENLSLGNEALHSYQSMQ